MIEFASNLLISRMREVKKEDSEFISSQTNDERYEQASPNKSNENHWRLRVSKVMPAESIRSSRRTKTSITSKIDMIAFIAFTFIFLMFNFVYYIVCF